MAEEVRKDRSSTDSDVEANEALESELDPNGTEQGAEGSTEEPQNRRARRAAASKARKQRMTERHEAEAVGLDAQEMLDDALVRSSDKMSKWLRKNSTLLQGVFVAGLVVWGGWGIYGWRQAKAQESASHSLALGLDAERGRLAKEKEEGADDPQIVDPSPVFADHAARLKAADDAFASAAQERAGSGTSMYAQLARASVLLDSGKHDEAKALYEELKRSPFASNDVEFKGRAIEGTALVAEAKGDKAAALKAYQELENTDAPGFKELALYAQARLQRDLKQPEAAKELLKKLREKLGPTPPDAFGFGGGYLQRGLRSLSEELGVEAPEAAAGPAAGSKGVTPEALQQLQQQLQQQLEAAQAGSAAPAQAPAP